ncbi:MAG TPA: hypothetical protein VFU36_00185 [Jatrophihabitans sp.]|nr:hypothetical protein [Jatrophihabitans sp.]
MPEDNQTTLLSYGFSADPAPIPISTAQVASQARVNISATGATPVYCNQIVVAVPVGSDAPSLFSQPPASSMNTNKWTVTSQLKDGSELWRGLDAGQAYATFTFNCISSADYLINYNLVFGVLGTVTGVIGDAKVAIQETSGTDPDPAKFTAKAAYFPQSKTWPQFYLKNLVATAPSTPTVPTTDFGNGAPIRFAWESNGSYFQLFQKDQTAPIYSGTGTTCTLPGGASRDTTFILAASMTGSPGQDSPQGGYQPIYLYDSIGITVANPVLNPTSVTVSGTLGVTGTSTLGTTNTGTLTSASATVTGALQAGSLSTGGTLNVTGNTTTGQATVNGALTANGGSTLNGATVNGQLTGTGSASLANLTVRGLTGSSGRVALLGTGVMLAQGTSIAQAGVLAQTDGFALAQVLTPGDNGKSSFAYGSINTLNTWFQVQGGTVGSFGAGWSDVMNNNPNAITVPIPAGTWWWYSAGNGGGNQRDSPIQIWWFPMGSGSSSTEQTFRRATDEELAAAAPPPPEVPDFSAFIRTREEAALEFVERLALAFEATLEEEVRQELSQLLRRL